MATIWAEVRRVATAESDSSRYRPDIDGLRAIAILAVIFFHAAPKSLRGGFNGVDVFFVISGFLITQIIVSDINGNRFSFASFYGKRVRRIFPALLVVVACTLAVGWWTLLQAEYASVASHALAGLVYVSNFLLLSETGYFDTAAEMKPFLHLWSLSVEEQFYIFWPTIIVVGHKTGRLKATVVTVTALSFICYVILKWLDPSASFYLLPSRLWELSFGALVAISAVNGGPEWRPESKASLTMSLAGCAMLIASFFISDKANIVGLLTLLPVLGTGLIILAGTSSFISRGVLSHRTIVAIGKISYPLYMWHWPLMAVARILFDGAVPAEITFGLVVASFGLAIITYWTIETTLRGMPLRRSVPILFTAWVALVAVTTTITILGGIRTSAGNQIAPRLKGDLGHVEIYEYMTKHFHPCADVNINAQAEKSGSFVRCFQSKKNTPVDLAIVGDSHAEHLFIGVAEKLPKRNVAFYIRSSLPLTSNVDFQTIFERVLESSAIKDVILTSYWRGRSRRDLVHQLKTTLQQLTSAGKNVYVTNDVPSFPFGSSSCKYERAFGIHNCGALAGPINSAAMSYSSKLAAAADGFRHVRIVDTMGYLCGKEECVMSMGDEVLYRDNNHLNILGSQLVGGRLGAIIASDER